ncbi:hypothetical protein OSB04_021428 [Centaurea solstitialis]|uniref:Uncharacterized protein n=1 Tax=Centaurea solstitialis TaxID=347529 RepID=A0AA38WE68_9ASTR|nr:hypothetical protein OSB04_021428 [Centaurea solstitialis]
MENVDMEVGGTLQILLDCKDKGQNLSGLHPPSIYIIPNSVRKISPDSFTPQVVSIGPLHRENKTLQQFEEQKTMHLHHLLERLNIGPQMALDECLKKVNASISRIRACYGHGETIANCKDAELAKMMVLDACFILDFLFLSEEHEPFISRHVILEHAISRDLVLLENQIPFFVLQDIFDCTISKLQPRTLIHGVLERLCMLSPFKGNNYVLDTTQPHHILGLLQQSFHPSPSPNPNPSKSTHPLSLEMPNHASMERGNSCERGTTCWARLGARPKPHHVAAHALNGQGSGVLQLLDIPNHSALELDKAGVKFKPNSEDANNYWPLDIGFSSTSIECFRWCWGDRTLRMPTFCIDDNTELFLRNVIAYEQCTPDVPDYVTSYVSAIDMLLDTKEDLSKLVESHVLRNHLGSNKEATKMLNNISKQFVFKEFYYTEQWSRLHRYYESYVPKNIALLKRTYFSSPWSIIALLAGIILFTLAIFQTVLRIIK